MGAAAKIPELRFEGFEGEWEVKTLGEDIAVSSASRVHKNDWQASGVAFFRSSDVISTYRHKENEKAYISQELYESLAVKSGKVAPGDLLVTGGGSVGIPYIVPDDEPLYFKDADLIWLRVSGTFDSSFLFSFFGSQPLREHLESISHVGTIAHYTIEQCKATPVSRPTNPAEQAKIGAFFKRLDSRIDLQRRDLEKLRQFKNAMLTKMFPQAGTNAPEVRFPGFDEAWEEATLGEIVDVRSGLDYKHLGSGDIPVYGTGGLMLHVDAALSWKDDAIGIGRKGTIDKPFKLRAPFWTVDTLFHAVPYENVNLDFVFAAAQRVDWQRHDESTGLPSLSRTAINAVEVLKPEPAEQAKIGAFFSRLDELIAMREHKGEKLTQIKKSLLQKMFV